MTKTLKLTDAFLATMKGKKCANGKDFFTYIDPVNHNAAIPESFRVEDIVADHTKVPIYAIPEEVSEEYRLRREAIPEKELIDYITRHEGSNATPPTNNITCYGCDKGETMEMSIALADRWLAKKVLIKNATDQTTLENIIEEVI